MKRRSGESREEKVGDVEVSSEGVVSRGKRKLERMKAPKIDIMDS